MFDIDLLICHQNPERSFCYNDSCFIVCARCTGIYFGALIGILSPLLSQRIFPRIWFWYAIALNLFTLTIPMIDTNWYRFTVGCLLGVTCSQGLGTRISQWYTMQKMNKELLWAGLPPLTEMRKHPSKINASDVNESFPTVK